MGQWEQAFGILGKMSQSGLKPDMLTFSALLSTCSKCQRWTEAIEILEQVRQIGVQMDSNMVNAITSTCERGQQYHHLMRARQFATNDLASGSLQLEPSVFCRPIPILASLV